MIHDVYTNIRQHSGATRPSREVARGVSGELILSNRDLSEAEREAPGVLEPWEARVYLA